VTTKPLTDHSDTSNPVQLDASDGIWEVKRPAALILGLAVAAVLALSRPPAAAAATDGFPT